MVRKIYLAVLTLGLLLSGIKDSKAQLFSRNNAKSSELAPKAVLVQLNTNQRKKAYFIKTKNDKLLKQINIDTDSIMHKMIDDYTDNFTYCPVYFYIDTNVTLIKQQKFDGILLNKDLQPIAKPVITAADNYVIALFGVPPIPRNNNSKDPYDTDYTLVREKKRLVVLDKNMEVLKKPLPNGSNNTFGGRTKQPVEHYKYTSPKFDLYYKPVVKNYNAKLEAYYGPYPY